MNWNHYEFNIICKYVHYNYYNLAAILVRYLFYMFQEPGQKLSFELKIILSVNCKARFFPYNGYRQQCKRLITTLQRSKVKVEK